MQDQVEALSRQGLSNATWLSSALDASELVMRYAQIEAGCYK